MSVTIIRIDASPPADCAPTEAFVGRSFFRSFSARQYSTPPHTLFITIILLYSVKLFRFNNSSGRITYSTNHCRTSFGLHRRYRKRFDFERSNRNNCSSENVYYYYYYYYNTIFVSYKMWIELAIIFTLYYNA